MKLKNGNEIITIQSSDSIRGKIRGIPQDCLSCGHSGVTEQDELYCTIKDNIVKDDYICENYN